VMSCCLQISVISTSGCFKRFTASSDFSKSRHCLGESPSLPTYFGGMSEDDAINLKKLDMCQSAAHYRAYGKVQISYLTS